MTPHAARSRDPVAQPPKENQAPRAQQKTSRPDRPLPHPFRIGSALSWDRRFVHAEGAKQCQHYMSFDAANGLRVVIHKAAAG